MSAEVENPDGSHTDVLVSDNGDGTFELTWVPDIVGKHKVIVKFGGKDIPGSSFSVNALMKVRHPWFASTKSLSSFTSS